ncbi:ligase-associated DNA damage response DEXH box helicase [Aquabacterium soli]|uniref:Ligase-associated DNA damage response DEXH box helicase n=1 Tax=Aquabacterium soli TaxID=2493092 RepID=A0A3R8S4R0_9BURK|nr:ligase-associated DNA damage response DEXH box helicase [Aquabacterium soli]RRS06005.1 ligase-associated DNA damage response DEXH box helicase [Aquabacterium soli]
MSGSRLVASRLKGWFEQRGWQPFKFQREVWRAVADGRSGLLHATTGAGKTYAVWLGALQALMKTRPAPKAPTPGRKASAPVAEPLTVLWITPMRALAADTERALRQPLEVLLADGGLRHWTLGARTGDTSSSERQAQSRRLPTALVTTPESLSLLLARADARETLGKVRMVVVDEWHELMGNKRGVQVQLALARLRGWSPGLCVWGMSATLGNLDEAMHTLLGSAPGLLVQGQQPKQLTIDTLLPAQAERFPWAGHLGLRMLPQVVAELDTSASSLVFTNTRSQSEVWYQALLEARPDWAGLIALHHGSLDHSVRDWVEQGLKAGQLKAVVCTSSLDLGVDFLPVERVLQIGSPKGVARLLQRAGRSGHAPGRPSRVTLVPTHSMELVEAAAVRAAVQQGQIEARHTPHRPLDVLVQHLVTVALGGGFEPQALYGEVRSTAAFADLSPEQWQWCLDFVKQGGASLAAYPDYHRVVPDEHGLWRVPDARLARRHRANIGTIVSDASMVVQFWSGGGGAGGARLGTVEESFIARMRPGDSFLFAGRLLELVRVHQMTAYVRRATGPRAAVPRWNGGRMPLSTTLADAMVQQLALADADRYEGPEMLRAKPLLDLQHQWSALPTPDTLLAETLKSREGWHLFLYPFAGRHVHLGLASLLAWRAASHRAGTFSIAVTDYGLELLSATEVDWAQGLPGWLGGEPGADGIDPAQERSLLLREVMASLNASELARRRFREIARVSGLIFQSHPGEKRSNKQLQASSSLFYEVFRQHDPANLLLRQAEEELLSQELDIERLATSLQRMRAQRLVWRALKRPTPFAFPLMVERFREQLSNESLADRIARMVGQLERAAGAGTGPADGDDEAWQQRVTFAQDAGGAGSNATRAPRAGRRPRTRAQRTVPGGRA